MDTTTKGDGPAVVAGDDFDPTLASDDIEITKRRDELFNDDHTPCTLEWRDLKYVVRLGNVTGALSINTRYNRRPGS